MVHDVSLRRRWSCLENEEFSKRRYGILNVHIKILMNNWIKRNEHLRFDIKFRVRLFQVIFVDFRE
jgi:hypothetical protein